MKKLLLLLLPTFVFAQADYNNLDSLTFKNKVEALLKETGENYTFSSYDHKDQTEVLSYKNVSDKDDFVDIYYEKNMSGENKNLEIKGVQKWSFKRVTGKYLSMFPIWQKIADPNADKVKLTSIRSQKKGSYYISEPYPEYWVIRFLN